MEQGYRIKYTYSSRDDMRKMKKYILETFKYRELGEKFTKNLFFYIVDEMTQTVTILRVMQDGMNWKFILKRWLKENE